MYKYLSDEEVYNLVEEWKKEVKKWKTKKKLESY
jgi:hypothetical protein